MESVVKPEVKNQVRANELLSILDQYSSKIKVLSLDCFDTILWRKTATPSDIFFDVQQKPSFESLNFTARLRAAAETKARRNMFMKFGSTEVKLHDIYQESFPSLSQDQLQALAEDELAAEMESCYAFPPIIELMRKAHERGLKIIIVSDTYLEENQLRRLLQHTLPADVMPMIMKIFCSCQNGRSKSDGLFKIVLDKIYESPKSVLHVGDHITSDYSAPRTLGVNTVHLAHHDYYSGELLRMQALSGGFLDPLIRHTRPLSSPFRGILAANNISLDDPGTAIGYGSLGPIMYAFGRFICDEVEQLKKAGKRPKVLFLMRDAYLPSLVCEELAGEEIGKRVRISRFASYASSFRTKEDVDHYVGDNVTSLRFYDICKQLLLPEKIAKPLIQKAVQANHPVSEFIKQIHQEEILETIFKESKIYRNRLKKHLEKEVGLEKGDTLVFVDLGYTGTAQLKLEPVFRDELGVETLGRYLIALRRPDWETSRKGLLDPSWCDDRTMHMLVAYVALLEQLCTSREKSVVDYDDKGDPIFSETGLSDQQNTKLEYVQTKCIQFARDAQKFFHDANTQISHAILRDAALGELGRLLFLPTKKELSYLQSFQFDLNLGTKEILNVFDEEKGLLGLRKRGLFFMERNLKSMRTNYPAELRTAGLELVLTLMAQHRIGFDVRVKDLSHRSENVNVIVMKDGKSMQTSIEALPTHDGYYSLLVPIGAGKFQIGIQFGLAYQWVQLESAEIITTAALFGSTESDHTEDASGSLIADQMEDKGGGLFECLSNTGLVAFMPQTELQDAQNRTLRVVFRPVVARAV